MLLTMKFNVKKLVFFIILLTIAVAVFECPEALATEGKNDNLTTYGLADYLCNALAFLTGTVGKSLAAFACIGVSLAFVGGKIAWTTILAFALGMGCIFGAPQIIKAFAGGDAVCSGNEGLN